VAKSRLVEFKKQSDSVQYSEIDIMEPGHAKWKDAYDFDVPVLHIDPITESGKESQPSLDAAKKLMHRFTVEEVEQAVREVKESSS